LQITRMQAAAVAMMVTAGEQVELGIVDVVIAATHTHSGPLMADYLSHASDPVLPKTDRKYVAWVGERMLEAACAAVKAAVPAEIGLAIVLVRESGCGNSCVVERLELALLQSKIVARRRSDGVVGGAEAIRPIGRREALSAFTLTTQLAL